MRFYPRLDRLVMERVLGARGKDVRAVVIFGRVAIIWDASDRGRKVEPK